MPRFPPLAWGLSLAGLLMALGLGLLLRGQTLQGSLDRALVQALAVERVAPVLSDNDEPAIRQVARTLFEDPRLGLSFIAVWDAEGQPLASFGRFENLALPWLSPPWHGALRERLYRVSSTHERLPVMAGDRRLGELELAHLYRLSGLVEVRALRTLKLGGFAVLLLGAVLAAWLLTLYRRGPWLLAGDVQTRLLARVQPQSRPQAESDATPEEPTLSARLAELGLGLVEVDAEGLVLRLNNVAEAFTGLRSSEADGRPFYTVLRWLSESGEPSELPVQRVLETAQPSAIVPGLLRSRDGQLHPVALRVLPVTAQRQSGRGALVLFRDRQVEYEERLALVRRERELLALLDRLDDALLTVDAAGRIRDANAAAAERFGYPREALPGLALTTLLPVPFLNNPGVRLDDFVPGASRAPPRVVAWRKDATTFPAELVVHALEVEGEPLKLLVVRDQADRLKRHNLASRLGRLIEHLLDEVYVFDAQTLLFLEVNRGARRALGYPAEAFRRMTPLTLAPELEPAQLQMHLNALRGGQVEQVVFRTAHQRADGSRYPVEVRLNYSGDEVPPVFIAVAVDIGERLAIERRLEQLAHHDMLTGLPNRRLLLDRLGQALALAERTGLQVAVILIDLDGFKAVNDQLGHALGDQVLVQVAQRLSAVLRASDTLARWGGDEFVVLAQSIRGPAEVEQLCERLLAALPEADVLSARLPPLGLSLGYTLYPLDDADPLTLIAHADEAMYRAKRAGGNRACRYELPGPPERARALAREREIHAAVALNQFQLVAQPVRDAEGGALGALWLDWWWDHPRQGRVGSSEARSAAARVGLAADLALWAIARAAALLQSERDLPAVPLLVDLAGTPVLDDESVDDVLHLLRRLAVPADRLVLVMDAAQWRAEGRAAAVAGRLRAAGLRLALACDPLCFERLGLQAPAPDLWVLRGALADIPARLSEAFQGPVLVEADHPSGIPPAWMGRVWRRDSAMASLGEIARSGSGAIRPLFGLPVGEPGERGG